MALPYFREGKVFNIFVHIFPPLNNPDSICQLREKPISYFHKSGLRKNRQNIQSRTESIFFIFATSFFFSASRNLTFHKGCCIGVLSLFMAMPSVYLNPATLSLYLNRIPFSPDIEPVTQRLDIFYFER